MKLEEISDIYLLIVNGTNSVLCRKNSILLRKSSFKKIISSNIIKLAFDTRRVDQESTYIARRGLQNYNRSENFITEATLNRLKSLKKMKEILELIKSEYGHENSWHDSYCRILLDTVNRSLREDQKDGDFTDSQPGVGSFDYIEEMLYVRYRINLSDVVNMKDKDLKKILLNKDTELLNADMNQLVSINKSDVARDSYDTLLNKLFDGVKATKENPEVERTITITIKDKFLG